MTNSQRHGTRNLPVNLPEAYIAELGRAAFERFDNVRSRLVVHLIEAGADKLDPALAARLRTIRRQFYGAALLVLFCASLFAHDALRGFTRGRRGREDEHPIVEMFDHHDLVHA